MPLALESSHCHGSDISNQPRSPCHQSSVQDASLVAACLESVALRLQALINHVPDHIAQPLVQLIPVPAAAAAVIIVAVVVAVVVVGQGTMSAASVQAHTSEGSREKETVDDEFGETKDQSVPNEK